MPTFMPTGGLWLCSRLDIVLPAPLSIVLPTRPSFNHQHLWIVPQKQKYIQLLIVCSGFIMLQLDSPLAACNTAVPYFNLGHARPAYIVLLDRELSP